MSKEKIFNISNLIFFMLSIIITIVLFGSGITVFVMTGYFAPLTILMTMTIFFAFLLIYLWMVVKTKLKNLNKKQLKYINISSNIFGVIFLIFFVSMFFATLGAIIYGPLVEQGFLYYFIGVGIYSLGIFIDCLIIQKYIKRLV